jgi:hypothetical protein
MFTELRLKEALMLETSRGHAISCRPPICAGSIEILPIGNLQEAQAALLGS